DRHYGADIFRMHYAPDIGLGAAHRDAGRKRDPPDLEMILEHAVIRLHHVVVGVLREFDAEPVGRLARAPGAERIDHHDVVAIGVDRTAGPDDRYAAGERGTLDPLLVHVAGVAGVIRADDHGIGDLARRIAPRRADRDVGG